MEEARKQKRQYGKREDYHHSRPRLESEDPATTAITRETCLEVDRVVRSMNDRDQRLIQLRFKEGLSPTEIAKRDSKPVVLPQLNVERQSCAIV